MRLLHLSDAHCEHSMLSSVLKREAFRIVVYTGDFECIDIAELLLEEGGEVYVVTGELDNPAIYRLLKRESSLLDGLVRDVGDFAVAGVGGLEAVNNVKLLENAVSRRSVEKPVVLVSHHPPAGVLDSGSPRIHGGLLEVRRLVERFKPFIHLFGHVHDSVGVLKQSGALFVNSGSIALGYYALVEVESIAVADARLKRV
ncbi:MAG: metallophosphoesterase family protein [Acidilobaceae archaeon]